MASRIAAAARGIRFASSGAHANAANPWLAERMALKEHAGRTSSYIALLWGFFSTSLHRRSSKDPTTGFPPLQRDQEAFGHRLCLVLYLIRQAALPTAWTGQKHALMLWGVILPEGTTAECSNQDDTYAFG